MSSLYLEHFGLSEAPFGITPNGRFFFAGQARGATLDALQHAVLDEDGIIVVLGEVGSGKTMLCRMLAERLQSAAVDLVYLANPSFGPREILDSLIADWGLDVPAGQPAVLSIQAALMARHEQGRRVVVLIDEAQAMQPDSLEEIKLLSNLETAQRKLMQIVLFGQPELQELLAQPRLRQVRDRVVHRFELQPLSDVESVAYIDHRLRRAGWRGARLFDARALKMLVSAGAGRMRAIHLLADKALLAAYADGAYEVLPAHVKRAQADLLLVGHVSSSGRPASGWARLPAPVAWALLAVSLALVVGMGLGWVLGQFQAPTPKSAQATKPPVVAEVVALAPSPAPAVETQPEATAPTTPPAAAPALPAATTPTPAPTAPAGPATATAPDPQRYEGLPSHLRQHVEHSRAVLDDPQLQGWTLQIGIAKDVAALKHLWSQVKDLSPLWLHDRYYSRTHPLTGHTGLGAVWAVYVGRYASRAEAQEALRALPAALQTYKPMVRTFGGIRSEPYPERPPL